MLIKDIITGLNTIGKAVKFLKDQNEIKNKTINLITKVREVLDTFNGYVSEIENVLHRLKDLLNK